MLLFCVLNPLDCDPKLTFVEPVLILGHVRAFDSLEEASQEIQKTINYDFSWYHIVDTESMKIVEKNGEAYT